MKKVSVLLFLTVLAGCSSTGSESTAKYSEALTQKCIASLPASDKDSKQSATECALEAGKKIHTAYRIYELRADADYKKCKESTSSKETAEECVKIAKEEYYKKVVDAK
ncbi:hypothetical protein GCM10008107_05910 [Psychrosphaera saromensis]|uniref:Lipoprotein n=1 Tax=Psychrosphaera saromensis TaxID=716813 RepID=A0A2S7UWX5_9GAMM|nr:hypothetical protein [Psychrosphaera saromensis]PQJ54486.1 hypothetical protein BTO11_13060 [Psychrosphaera saromensis]GHB59566.1 hypothetical protein GCM10008107_05910 [Psychrosphaera saromensis]GLQ14312.1 hypothetical protein GCM10007917_17670 [Psychrosphaera saromensis]